MKRRRRYENVTSYRDRHGAERWRWRKTGFKPYSFKAPYGSAEFDAEYQACRAPLPIGANRAAPGTVDDLVTRYLKSAAFLRPGAATQHSNRLILERFRAEHGEKPVAALTAAHVEVILIAATKKRKEGKRWVGGPEGARKLRKELRKLFHYAKAKAKLIAANPVEEADALPLHKSSGHHTWTEDEIARYQARHPLGTMPRLALEIMLWTGQRMGDAHRLGPSDLKGGRILYKQEKGGKSLWLPAAPQLTAAITATPVVGTSTYIVARSGKPFSRKGFNNKMRQWCDEAGLPHCTAHGLRKAIARRLAEAGATNQQIKAIGGWSNDRLVSLYTRGAEQQLLATQGFALIEEK